MIFDKIKDSGNIGLRNLWEAPTRFELVVKVLQTSALPLGYGALLQQYRLIFNSDDKKYGGEGVKRPLVYKAEKQECDNRPFSFAYPLPAFGVAVFVY